MAQTTIELMGEYAPRPTDGITFASLAQRSLVVPSPPRFIFGPCEPDLLERYYSHFGLSSVGIFTARDVSLRGAFLLSRGTTNFACPELNVFPHYVEAEANRLARTDKTSRTVRLDGRRVLLAGPGSTVYGHWLIDHLPKIGLLNIAGYDVHRLSYLVPSNAGRYVLEWLALFGIGADQIVAYDSDVDIVEADELLIPTIMHNGVRASPLYRDIALYLRHLISRNNDLHQSPVGPRVFLSRGKRQGRVLINRDEVEKAAADAGFAVVIPERLSLIDQVRLFAGARAIMGEYGSALHGSLFSPAGTVVCVLRGTRWHPGFCQSGIGGVLQQPTGYIFGGTSGDEDRHNFYIDLKTLSACLQIAFSGQAEWSLADPLLSLQS